MTDTEITVTSTIGKRRASASTNVLDDASLRPDGGAGRAPREAVARRSRDHAGARRRSSTRRSTASASTSAALDPEARARGGARVIERAAEVKRRALVFVAGFIEANARARAIATSSGLFAYHRSTDARCPRRSARPTAPDRVGRPTASRDWSDVDPAALGARAAQKARGVAESRRRSSPGCTRSMLEPQAVADLDPAAHAASFNAREADEGRSPFSKRGRRQRIGEKMADERVTIYSDPADPGAARAAVRRRGAARSAARCGSRTAS